MQVNIYQSHVNAYGFSYHFFGGEHLQFNEIFKAITFRKKHGLLLLLTFRQDLLAIFRRPQATKTVRMRQ